MKRNYITPDLRECPLELERLFLASLPTQQNEELEETDYNW